MKSLRDWKPGDNIRTNDHHQQDPEAIRELQQLFRGGQFVQWGAGLEGGLGKIMSEGPAAEADYTDARYWIEREIMQATVFRALPTLSEDVTDAEMDVGGLPGEPSVVTATNIAELAAGTHELAVGEYVWWWIVWARGDPSTRHYIFVRSVGDTGGIYLKLTSEEATEGHYGAKSFALDPGYTPLDPAGSPPVIDGTFAASEDVYAIDTSGYDGGWQLTLNDIVQGTQVGTTNETPARKVVVFDGARGRFDGSSGGLVPGIAATDNWSRGAGTNDVTPTAGAVDISVLCVPPTYDAATNRITFKTRVLSFDAAGKLYAVGTTDDDGSEVIILDLSDLA